MNGVRIELAEIEAALAATPGVAAAYERALVGREADRTQWLARIELSAAAGAIEAQVEVGATSQPTQARRLRVQLATVDSSAEAAAAAIAASAAAAQRHRHQRIDCRRIDARRQQGRERRREVERGIELLRREQAGPGVAIVADRDCRRPRRRRAQAAAAQGRAGRQGQRAAPAARALGGEASHAVLAQAPQCAARRAAAD